MVQCQTTTSFFQLKGFMENIFGMLGIKYKEEIFEEKNNVFSGGVIYTSGKIKWLNVELSIMIYVIK